MAVDVEEVSLPPRNRCYQPIHTGAGTAQDRARASPEVWTIQE